MKKPGILNGALFGILLTVPMIMIFYLGWKAAGLPFVPFDLFDWISRRLPGAVITFGIETMVGIIRGLNLGSTAVVAKTAEQLMGVVQFLIGGIIAGMLVNIVLRSLKDSSVQIAVLIGGILSIPIEIISLTHNQTSSVSLFVIAIWILLVFIAWGISFGWIYRRMWGQPKKEEEPVNLSRRQFLVRFSSIAAVITVAGTSVGALFGKRKVEVAEEPWSATHAMPNADANVQPAPGTRPEFTSLKNHYRIDIDTMPPRVDLNDWRLKVSGLVKKPLEFTMDELRSFPQMNQFITLECISNPIAGDLISTTRWTGVSMQQLLPEFGLNPEVTHFIIRAVDGFAEAVSLEDIKNDNRIMLTYEWDGLSLPVPHGFPLRIYIPDRYGMKQPKWIESLEATDHWEEGYWVERGWDRNARVRTTSVIDKVATDAIMDGPDGNKLVPVGGIAYAGARGISKVEIQADTNEWQEAELRTPLSATTWVIWRYNFPYSQGEHTFTVRCYEGDGTPQIATFATPHPSGATGLHSVSVKM